MQTQLVQTLSIKPKRLEEVYRQVRYLLQFNPDNRRVDWQFPWTVAGVTVHFYATGANFDFARRSARRKIDELIDGKK